MKSVLIGIAALCMSVQAVLAKEIALVIGIDEYTELPSLNKALEDAVGYRDLFESKGFEVHFLENPTGETMRVELARFYDRIETGDTVVFVYSGHGWSDGALNYLVPADTADISSTMIAAELSVPLKNGVNGILDRISAQGAGLTVAVVDACRNNPFSGAETRTLGVIGGLAPVEPPSGTFIVYSAASNQTALDRLGEADTQQYSVFTRFFLPNLRDNGDLRKAIVETRGQVRAAADIIGHNQRPAYYDELTGTSCLFGDCIVGARDDAPTDNQATLTWSLIQNTTDPIVLSAFIRRFEATHPELTQIARAAFNQLDVQSETTLEPPAPAQARAPVIESAVKDDETEKMTALDEARSRIIASDGSTLMLNDLPNLTSIPQEIQGLNELILLDLSNTSITDLSPVLGLDLLEQLNLTNVPIQNIDLVGQLSSLETLELQGTLVSDITALYRLPNLAEPGMNGTPLANLREAAFANIDSGYNYWDGEGVSQNSETAFKLFQQAYVQYDWSGEAANVLGLMLEEGDGVEEDDAMAVKYYQIAVDRFNGDAAFDLALMNEWGEGIPENNSESIRLNILSLRFGSDLVILRAEEDLDLEPFPDVIAEGIQIALRDLGLYAGVIDGDLGRASQAAMWRLCDCEG